MFGWLNVGSLLLGLIAWIIPVVNIMRNNYDERNSALSCIFSIGACGISLCLQIFYNRYLVQIEDWSALMDIVDSVSLVSAVLLIITLGLNTVAYIVNSKRKAY